MMDGSQCSAGQTQVRPAEQTETRWSIKLAMSLLRHFVHLRDCWSQGASSNDVGLCFDQP